MATSAGELIYTVDVDTAKAVTQARQAEKAVGALETEMNSAAAASAKLNTNLTATAKGVGQATTGMRGLSGVAGQIGFQLQDIAVQAQMGTSALTILGQQGSQVASVFGPTGAIVGAIIAVGSALLGMATASGTAGESIEELAKKADSLGKSQLEDAINKANVELNDQQQVLIKTTEKVQRMEAAQKQSGLTAGVYAVKLAEARAEQEAQSDVVNQLVANIERLTNAMYGNVDAAEAARKATQEIVSDLEFETRIMGLNEAQRATAIAQRRAGVDASSAEGKAIENAATAMVNESQRLSELDRQKRESEAAARKAASQAESEQKRLQGQYQSNENSLKKMAQQLSIAGLSTQGLAKEAAELAAVYSLGGGATQTQIEQAKQLAGALFDLNEQKRRQAEIEGKRKEAGRFVEQAAFDAASPLEQIDIEEQAKLAKLEEYRQLQREAEEAGRQADIIGLQEYEATKANIIQQAENERAKTTLQNNSLILSSTSDLFGGLADLTAAFAGEQSGAYRAIFAISKGFAIANAALNLQSAISQALGDPTAITPAQKFANMAAVAAAGASLASNIASVNYGGARQFGGPTDAGSVYRLGENNQPEVWKTSAGMFGISGDRGNVTPLSDINGGGSFQQSVQVHNYSGENVQTKTSMDGKQLDVIIGEVAKQISQRRGGVGRALASSTATKWKAQ